MNMGNFLGISQDYGLRDAFLRLKRWAILGCPFGTFIWPLRPRFRFPSASGHRAHTPTPRPPAPTRSCPPRHRTGGFSNSAKNVPSQSVEMILIGRFILFDA